MMLCSVNLALMSQLVFGKYAPGVPYDVPIRFREDWCDKAGPYQGAGVEVASSRRDDSGDGRVTARPEPRLNGGGRALHNIVSWEHAQCHVSKWELIITHLLQQR